MNKKQSKINWIAFILIKEPEPLFLSILEQSGRILILHLHLIQPLKFHEHRRDLKQQVPRYKHLLTVLTF